MDGKKYSPKRDVVVGNGNHQVDRPGDVGGRPSLEGPSLIRRRVPVPLTVGEWAGLDVGRVLAPKRRRLGDVKELKQRLPDVGSFRGSRPEERTRLNQYSSYGARRYLWRVKRNHTAAQSGLFFVH